MISKAERDRAVTYLEQTKADWLKATAGLTIEQWRFKPAPDAWGIGECAEHITVVEARLLGMIQKMNARPDDSPEELAKADGKEALIVERVGGRAGKAVAPEAVRPGNRFPEREQCMREFETLRDRTIEYARSTEDRLRLHLFPHFALGPLDGYQWLLFLAAHSERHLKQVEQVKTTPAFPGR